jgi:hypothetical protein
MKLVQESPQVKRIDGLLTITGVARLFSRSALTILQWRTYNGLPYVVLPGDERPSIRYELDEVRAWARREGKAVLEEGGTSDAEQRANPTELAGAEAL